MSATYVKGPNGEMIAVGMLHDRNKGLEGRMKIMTQRMAEARRILAPLAGKDRTVDAAIAALDGVMRNA
jgi:hypothetical protein